MDTNKTEQQAKEVLQKTASWGRKTFTARRLKKGAGCVLALAVLCGAGKIAAHKARANARLQEGEARTTLLQSLAAQKNITLVSTDQVKEAVANTLGTDPSSVTFRSVQLEDKLPNRTAASKKTRSKPRTVSTTNGTRRKSSREKNSSGDPRKASPSPGKHPKAPKPRKKRRAPNPRHRCRILSSSSFLKAQTPKPKTRRLPLPQRLLQPLSRACPAA